MNQRIFDLVRAVTWAVVVAAFGYLTPHGKFADRYYSAFLGKNPTNTRFVFFVLSIILSIVLVWVVARLITNAAVNRDEPEVLGGVTQGLLQGLATVATVALVFALCRSGDKGSLRYFVFDLLRGKEPPRALFGFFFLFGAFIFLLLSNRNIRAIFNKELRIYFTTPIAYAVIMLFMLLAGFFFQGGMDAFIRLSDVPMQMRMRYQGRLNLNAFVFANVFSTLGTILIFLVPILTMRLISEERKNRTYELLMTSPITSAEIIVGKYLSSFGVLITLISLTFLYPTMVGVMAKGSFEWAPIFTGYLGLYLLAGAFVAIGLFSSTLTENQVIAAVVTFGVLLLLWILGWAASSLGDGSIREIISYLAVTKHLQSFAKGLIEVKDVVYYLSLIVFANLLAHRMVESQRWR